jgi:GNAT superfamily N-acetyltransferase
MSTRGEERMADQPVGSPVEARPLTPERWADLEALFGPKGAVAGCWCMWWRQSGAEHDRAGNDGNRAALRRLAGTGTPGLLGYVDGEPVGWCSFGRREEFARLNRSPKLKAVDDEPVWSIVCFYVRPSHRASGVAAALLDAAVEHVRRAGARLVEAYPIDPAERRVDSGSAFTGLLPMFEQAGFEEVARRAGRPIVRRRLEPATAGD